MKTKHLTRAIAATFVAGAIAMAMLTLRESPAPPVPEVVDITDMDSDPLPALLRRCRAMGEAAASSTLCSRTWADNRRRFLAGIPGGAEPRPSVVTTAVEPPIGPSATPALKGR